MLAFGAVVVWGHDGARDDGRARSPSTARVRAISAGGSHTCAITEAGGVKCWGWEGRHGELGNGARTDSLHPVSVVGLSSGAVAVSAGASHSCAVTTVGAIKCWGENRHGQLGDGTTTTRLTPVDVVGLSSGAFAVSAGPFGISGRLSTCAITEAGAVKCWGVNTQGQVGDGTTVDRHVPTSVVGLSSGMVAVSVGGDHACAVTAAGAVECWGDNTYGQLGDGTTTTRLTPVDVVGLSSGVVAVSAGLGHTCALTDEGAVECWGDNSLGQLGDGTTTNSHVPARVVGLSSRVVAISAGWSHMCALTDEGAVACWGNNRVEQLGNETAANSPVPAFVVGLSSGVVGIAAGAGHACAVTTSGAVECWGGGFRAQLGVSPVPVDVVGLSSGAGAIDAGGGVSCALTEAGAVTCWGRNPEGDFGGIATPDSPVPVDVVGLSSGVCAVSAGGVHTCAVTAAGAAKCWGDNRNGQLGDGTKVDSPDPVDVAGLSSGVVAVSAGGSGPGETHGQTCAVTAAGAVECWGDNSHGQLGDGTTTTRLTPVDVVGLSSSVVAVSAGSGHTCALTAAGAVKCWGDGSQGQIGNDAFRYSSVPVDVVGLWSGVVAVSAGSSFTCAVTAAGAVKCWGYNGYGELGIGSSAWRSSVPRDVVGLSSGVVAVSAGSAHACAVTDAGAVECWGRGHRGQLGNDTLAEKSREPVDVVGLSSGVVTVSAGSVHTCALTTAGAVRCWGSNRAGALGDGAPTRRRVTVDVIGP